MPGHPRNVDQLLDRRTLHVTPRGFGDVDGEIADPLEVGVDLDRGDDRPQVGGHRLVQRQQREAAVVDLDVQRVQRLVAGERPVDELVVAIHQPLDRDPHLLFGEAAHLEQPGLELLELFLEMPDDAFRLRSIINRTFLSRSPRSAFRTAP